MKSSRLEAFSDGVLAIIITIMVLEMKVPHDSTLHALQQLWPVFLSYVLSFMNIGIYWNNHHHLMHAVDNVNGKVLWANTHLLFWLSLIPFATGWMGENHFAQWPVAIYGVVLLMAGMAYYILAHTLIRLHGKDSTLALALRDDKKGVLSVVFYAIGVIVSFFSEWMSLLIYFVVTAIWFIPDKRIEDKITDDENLAKPDKKTS